MCLSWFLRLCWFMVYRTRNITVGVRLSCRADRTDRTNRIALCPDVITRCTLRMSTDCTDRTNRNALCPHVIMRCTLCMSTDCTDRTNRNALCPDVIMRCTLRMSSDRTDRTNRNALCTHVILRCTLRMCSAYGPWVIVTVCAERTVRQLLLTVRNSAAVLDMTVNLWLCLILCCSLASLNFKKSEEILCKFFDLA